MHYKFTYDDVMSIPSFEYLDLGEYTTHLALVRELLNKPLAISDDTGCDSTLQVHLIVRSNSTNDVVLKSLSHDNYILEATKRFNIRVINEEGSILDNLMLSIAEELKWLCKESDLDYLDVGVSSMLVPTSFIRTHNLTLIYTLTIAQEFIEKLAPKNKIVDVANLRDTGLYIANQSVIDLIKPYKEINNEKI